MQIFVKTLHNRPFLTIVFEWKLKYQWRVQGVRTPSKDLFYYVFLKNSLIFGIYIEVHPLPRTILDTPRIPSKNMYKHSYITTTIFGIVMLFQCYVLIAANFTL